MTASNYFQTPADPEGYSATLPLPTFRSIDFSALEYSTLQQAIVEYVRTYYRDEFNDIVATNGFMMFTEVICYVGHVLSQRGDILADDGFLPTCRSVEAASEHLALIGQEFRRQTPATVDVECAVNRSVATDIEIPAGYQFHLTGPDGAPLTYELFSAPFDWVSPIVIPARKRAVIGWAIEGAFGDDVTATSAGGANQTVFIDDASILNEPIIVEVGEFGETWQRVQIIENSDATDKVYQVRFTDDGATIMFGDNISGQQPLSGQPIRVRYRTGGGSRGRIGTGFINLRSSFSPNPPASASIEVSMRSVTPSSGGYDAESLDDAKKRGPRSWATHNNAVSASDYLQLATQYSHPVYGSVLKAVATIYTSLNANIVRLYILADGEDGAPVKPSVGLKTGLRNHLNEINVLTDDIEVGDGDTKPVDVTVTITVAKNSDAGTVKERVDAAINDFFSTAKWELGQPLYVSDLYDILTTIDGVRYVNIFAPKDDILPAREVGDNPQAVKFNELIILGNKSIKIFYEK